MSFPKKVDILEACPRDGWQNHPVQIPTETKIKYIKKMIDYGAKRMDLTSFVSPKYVPQMADAAAVVAGVSDYAKERGCRLYGLTLNGKGVENAMKTDLEYVSFVLSVSREHQIRNSRRTIEESRQAFRDLVPKAEGLNIQLALPCVFGSPFGDEIDMDLVKDIIEEAFSLGIKEIGLADTAGVSTPAHTREVLRAIKEYCDPDLTTIHLHDTYGMGMANAYVALEEGYSKFDASLGAMGGCPFVPGAKGNIAIEDLIHMCEAMGLETGYDLYAVCKTAVEMGEEIQAVIDTCMTKVCAHHE
ncbi:MAG: hydroxymethylglutaryl-CoA lyase [Mogibacterium sp.]|nr:hydroxymethylglutaryl-CoA lyase [Mogibacterium sp.]